MANTVACNGVSLGRASMYRDVDVGGELGCRVCECNDNDEIVRARVFTGSYEACVSYIRNHNPRQNHDFGIIYNRSGRLASFCI